MGRGFEPKNQATTGSIAQATQLAHNFDFIVKETLLETEQII